MINNPFFKVITGTSIGLIIGLLFENIPAGFCLGTSIGLLAMLLGLAENENKRN